MSNHSSWNEHEQELRLDNQCLNSFRFGYSIEHIE